MDASTGYLVREGLDRSSASISTACLRTPILAGRPVNFSEIGLIPPHCDQQRIRIGPTPRCVLEGGNLLFPQDSIRLLFRDAQFDDDLPNAGLEFVHDFNDASTSAVEPLGLASHPQAFVFAPTTCLQRPHPPQPASPL